MAEFSISMRLVRPFLEAAREAGLPPRMLQFWDRLPDDARISESTSRELLRAALQMTHEPGLGLRAALHALPADAGPRTTRDVSDSSILEALELLHRELDAVRHAPDVGLFVEDRSLRLGIPNREGESDRALIHFALGVVYLTFRCAIGGDPAHLELWFTHSQPTGERFTAFHDVFDPRSTLRFDAPRYSFIARSCDLDLPIAGRTVCARQVLSQVAHRAGLVPIYTSFVDQVRLKVVQELQGGNPTAEYIASALGMSRRTLVRRLEEEGTSFKDVVNHVRCSRALRFLVAEQLDIAEVVRRLGYSDRAAFYKAFKRWFGLTPSDYLRRNRRSSRPVTLV